MESYRPEKVVNGHLHFINTYWTQQTGRTEYLTGINQSQAIFGRCLVSGSQCSGCYLPHVEAGDGPAYDHALNLRGALEDGEVVGRTCSRAARMLTISAWPGKKPVIIDGHLPSFSRLSRNSDGTDASIRAGKLRGLRSIPGETSRKRVQSVPRLQLEGTQAALPLPGTRRREREPAEQPSQGPLSLEISGGT